MSDSEPAQLTSVYQENAGDGYTTYLLATAYTGWVSNTRGWALIERARQVTLTGSGTLSFGTPPPAPPTAELLPTE